MIDEIYNLLKQVDPVAKACMPIYVTVFLLSDYYGPSFSSANRVMMNTMYRLGPVYTNSAEINRKVYGFLSETKEQTGEEKNIQDYISESVELGQLSGLQFKMLMFVKKLDDKTEDLYTYPEIEILDTEFDALLYPNGTVGEEYPSYVVY